MRFSTGPLLKVGRNDGVASLLEVPGYILKIDGVELKNEHFREPILRKKISSPLFNIRAMIKLAIANGLTESFSPKIPLGCVLQRFENFSS